MEKEIKIVPPEGYEIDKENSTLEYIKFKRIKKWRDNKKATIKGYYISTVNSQVAPSSPLSNNPCNYSIFATEKQAKSALAMARISQIMANDKRFGGIVTDEEWRDDYTLKHIFVRCKDMVIQSARTTYYEFLAFHTIEQCDLFFKENEDLVRDYLML